MKQPIYIYFLFSFLCSRTIK